jgi:hypothetical protein
VDLLAPGDVPVAEVPPSRNHPLAVGREGKSHFDLHSVEAPIEAAGGHIPEGKARARVTRRQQLTVGREFDLLLHVLDDQSRWDAIAGKRVHWPAGGRGPEPYRVVSAVRSHHLVVR